MPPFEVWVQEEDSIKTTDEGLSEKQQERVVSLRYQELQPAIASATSGTQDKNW